MRITPRRPRSAGSTGFVRCGPIGWVEGTLGDDFCILKEYAELSSRAPHARLQCTIHSLPHLTDLTTLLTAH